MQNRRASWSATTGPGSAMQLEAFVGQNAGVAACMLERNFLSDLAEENQQAVNGRIVLVTAAPDSPSGGLVGFAIAAERGCHGAKPADH